MQRGTDEDCYNREMEHATPLNSELAVAFLRKLGKHLDYNINIMDSEGVIIASRDGSRVGTFHESAWRLLQTGAEIERIEVSDSPPPGVRPGVNLPIEHSGRNIGVVGVTGDPREVASVAYAIKTSVESMVELEAFKDKALQRLDRKNLLMNYLLYDQEAPRAAVEALAAKLGYESRTPRAPVLFRLREGLDAADALAAFKKSPAHLQSDISWATPDGAVLVFKTLGFGKAGIIADYEAGIDHYAQAAEASLGARSGGLAPFRAFAGAFQTDLSRYRGSWRQVLWLEDRCVQDEGRVVFFYRRLGEWLASRAPRNELVDAFESVAALLSEGFADELGHSVRALLESSFNGKEAAARLGIHRNTLAARLSRFQAVFGFDPRNDARARDFLSVFSAYLELRGRDRAG